MRVSLNQDEILEAISEYITAKLHLPPEVNGEMTFIAGRSPRGVSCEVELSYPGVKSSNKWITADDKDGADNQGDPSPTSEPQASYSDSPGDTVADEAASTDVPVNVPSANNIFG